MICKINSVLIFFPNDDSIQLLADYSPEIYFTEQLFMDYMVILHALYSFSVFFFL